jgi:hypothetical protein
MIAKININAREASNIHTTTQLVDCILSKIDEIYPFMRVHINVPFGYPSEKIEEDGFSYEYILNTELPTQLEWRF